MMMSRFLTRAQLGRVTWWMQTQSFPSSTVTNDPSSNIQAKWPEHVVHLTCRSSASSGFCQVYLVGTNHNSKKSCIEVQEIPNSLKPEVVFLELCSSREDVLKQQKGEQVDSELETIPGSDFRAAYAEATKYGGRVFLGDRPIEITLRRAWRKMPLSEKARFLFCLFGKDSSCSYRVLDDLGKLVDFDVDMDMDMVTIIRQVLAELFPTLFESILHERDLYMSSKLLEVAKKSKCVVAVVGKGHLKGIKKHWQQPILVEDLLKIPPPKPAMSTIILTSAGLTVAWVFVSVIWGYVH